MSTRSEALASVDRDAAAPQVQHGKVRIGIERRVVQTVEEMTAIADDPVNAGRTFEVSQEVFEHFRRLLSFLPRTAGEIERLNSLLGTTFDESATIGMTRACVCQHCGHEFTFSDHVEAAMQMGLHTRDELKRILDGDHYYLTVDTEKPRAVLCVSCKEVSLTPHCCYAGSSYGYA